MASISRKKKLLFALVTLVGFPLLLLLGTEITLRLVGYGYDSGFFVKEVHEGKRYLRNNEWYGRRFFPGDLFRFIVPFKIPVEKAPGTHRIFILGSSAAMGDPDPSYAISRQLEVILPQAYPEIRFEIINAAMTAINSHVVLEIARDIIAHGDPDLLIIYEGNNEVIGPFGPGTVFTKAMQSRGFIRLNYALKRTKIGQLLADLSDRARISDNGAPEQWGGLEMFVDHEFSLGDPRLERVYSSFQENLRDIATLASAKDIPTILSTVSVNSKDFPPFASTLPAAFSVSDLIKHYSDANYATLQLTCTNILEAHPDNAFAHFMLGQALLKQEQPTAARPHLIKAKDLDRLRFRTDSRLNETVRSLSAELSESGHPVFLAEVDTALNSWASDGLSGYSQFFEHVHFSFQGNYEAAVAMLPAIHKSLAAIGKADGTRDVPLRIVTLNECKLSLAYTPWEQSFQLLEMANRLSQPPFTRQPFNTDRINALRNEAVLEQRKMQNPEAQKSLDRWLTNAVDLRPQDWVLHRNFAQHQWDEGRYASAIEHFQKALEGVPGETALLENLATLYADIGSTGEARTYLDQLLAKKRITPRYHFIDGQVGILEKRYDAAEAAFRKSLELHLYSSACLAGLGEVAFHRGNIAEAHVFLQQSKQIETNAENEYLRALLAAHDKQTAIAKAAIESALRYKKNLPRYLQFQDSLR